MNSNGQIKIVYNTKVKKPQICFPPVLETDTDEYNNFINSKTIAEDIVCVGRQTIFAASKYEYQAFAKIHFHWFVGDEHCSNYHHKCTSTMTNI